MDKNMKFYLFILILIFLSSFLLNCDATGRNPNYQRRLEKLQARVLRRLLGSSISSKSYSSLVRRQFLRNPDLILSRKFQKYPFSRRGKFRKRQFEGLKDTDTIQSCCPQKFEVIEPKFGRNRTGHLVELYRGAGIHQKFHEVVCEPNVLEKPCKHLSGRNKYLSRCTQQHIYSYALLKSGLSSSGYILDHIRIRSGCTCRLYLV